MKTTVVFEDGVIIIDGDARHGFTFTNIDPNWRVMQWQGDRGWIEVHHGERIWLDDATLFEPYQQMHEAAKASADMVPSLSEAQEQKINEAWVLSQQRFAESEVSVTVNGALHTYGCDPITRENITAINTAISRAPHLVPNPRPYTPKSEAPVMTTHDEFLAIYLAGLAQGDAFYQAYYAHKTAILASETVEKVLGYEADAGWPA